jgi:hypothetical protein
LFDNYTYPKHYIYFLILYESALFGLTNSRNRGIMKLKLFVVVVLIAGTMACTQTTCPTYTKDTIKKVEKPATRV